jgi:hypothetical protein
MSQNMGTKKNSHFANSTQAVGLFSLQAYKLTSAAAAAAITTTTTTTTTTTM